MIHPPTAIETSHGQLMHNIRGLPLHTIQGNRPITAIPQFRGEWIA
jgi:hypothetical protein